MKVGQLVFDKYKNKNAKEDSNEEFFYDIGVITAIYDQVIIIKMKYRNTFTSVTKDDFKENLKEDEVGNILLTNDGKPSMAKRDIFGRYKL